MGGYSDLLQYGAQTQNSLMDAYLSGSAAADRKRQIDAHEKEAKRMQDREARLQAEQEAQRDLQNKQQAGVERVEFARDQAARGMPQLLQERAPAEYSQMMEKQKAAESAQQNQRGELRAKLLNTYSGLDGPARENAKQYISDAARRGLIDPVDFDQADGVAQLEAARYGVKTDPEQQPKTTNDIIDYERAKNDPGYAAFIKEQARSRGVNVNVGGRELPTSVVTEIADAGSAVDAAKNLLENFKNLKLGDSVIDQIGAAVSSLNPNSDSTSFDNAANVATQVIGSYLENGKLADADSARYRAMMPRAGDSSATAIAKINAITDLIASRNKNRAQALKDAGYRAPTQDTPNAGKAPGPKAGDLVGGYIVGKIYEPANPEDGSRVWTGSGWAEVPR